MEILKFVNLYYLHEFEWICVNALEIIVKLTFNAELSLISIENIGCEI